VFCGKTHAALFLLYSEERERRVLMRGCHGRYPQGICIYSFQRKKATKLQENKTKPAREQVWDGKFPVANRAASFSGGDGSEGNPYLISTPWDLAQIPSNVTDGNEGVGVYFKMTNDIYLNYEEIDTTLVDPGVPGAAGYDGGQTLVYEWKPIGGAGAGPDSKGHSYCFRGNFDGGDHTIYNAFYNRSISSGKGCNPANEVGIFGDITNEAEIKNLKTEGGYIGANISVGGIVGRTWGGDIINCHNKNFVYGVGSQGAGGVAGTSWVYIPDPAPDGTRMSAEPPVIDKCSNKATVVSNYLKNDTKPSGSGGGIVGENEGGVINCWNEAVVTCRLNVGGIVGSNQNSSGGEPPIQVDPSYINNCYNTGDIGHSAATGVNSSIPSVDAVVAGGIMGYQTGTCENVYNIGNITDNGEDTEDPVRNAAGQIIGELDPNAGETNDYFYTSEEVVDPDDEVLPPVGIAVTPWNPTESFEFDSSFGQKNTLLGALNSWSEDYSDNNYLGWIRDTTNEINDGYPVFDLD
jgi:hypothetical protein